MLLCASQEQTIRTNYVKHHIDKTSKSSLCRLCGKNSESVQCLVSGCEKLAQSIQETIQQCSKESPLGPL